MKSVESHSALSPLRLVKRPDGSYARDTEAGEEVLVSKKPDGSWDVYQSGSSEALGIWRDAPKTQDVRRSGLLGLLGFRKPVTLAPDRNIDPNEVRELAFLDSDIQGKEIYRDVSLPDAPTPKPWKAEHYQVKMRIDPERGSVESKATIKGRALRPLSAIPLDLGSFPSSLAVTDDEGRAKLFNRTQEGLAVVQQLHSNQEFSFAVEYSGAPKPVSHPGVPADLGWLSSDSSVVTFNGAARSSSWLPGDDSPANKATYDFQIEVPKNHFAVANGKLLEERELENGNKLFHYRSSFPMASYLASVNTFNEREYRRTQIGDDFEVIHPHDLETRVRGEFKNHDEMFKLMGECLGPYPFDSYGAIVTHLPVDSYKTRFTDGTNTYEADSNFEIAFEAQTRPIFQADAITGTGDFEPTIIHELAHQWFGNAVTNTSEKDVWVNEAFPSYSGWLWVEKQKGEEVFEREMRAMHDSVKEHKFTDTMADPHRDKLFSQENYARMTLSMHAMRRELGDEQFFRTLRGAVSEHKYQSVSVEELSHTMNRLNGGKLSGFFMKWLHSTELPPYPDSQTGRSTVGLGFPHSV